MSAYAPKQTLASVLFGAILSPSLNVGSALAKAGINVSKQARYVIMLCDLQYPKNSTI